MKLSIGFGALVLVTSLVACSDSGSDLEGSIENKTVSGVSQKGPFLNGSTVTLHELDGESLVQTGKSFTGEISGDEGAFTIPSVNLSSQYALLTVDGYYRNEVTGLVSKYPITLKALTDLSNRNSVNVNLLTHLEYKRALHLVTEGLSVVEAKQQAEHEVLTAFGIDSVFDVSETLSILESGEGNAALLAISLLLQGDRVGSDFGEFIANICNDFEKDGTLDDAQLLTDLADWASDVSVGGQHYTWTDENESGDEISVTLTSIRSNILGWNLSTTVPNFEKYVNAYWYQNYGLGECTTERQDELKQNGNSSSAYSAVSYLCDDGAWRKLTYDEETHGICTVEHQNEIFADLLYNEYRNPFFRYYMCDNGDWVTVTTLKANTVSMTCLTDGTIQDGIQDSSAKYVCDDSLFREATEQEISYGKGCVRYLEGEKITVEEVQYTCESGIWK